MSSREPDMSKIVHRDVIQISATPEQVREFILTPERIADYLECSLRKPDAIRATIGAINSDLMLIGYRLNRAVHTAMETTPEALNEYGKLMPAVESLLKVYKQIDRFTQLEVRLTKAEQAPANIPQPEPATAACSEEMES